MTPTSDPHEAQTTEPVVWRLNIRKSISFEGSAAGARGHLTTAANGSMKVLITGGTGYLGGALVGALLAAGHRCVVFARTASANAPRHELVEPVDGDVRDRDAVQRAAAGVDAICHAAALVSIWRARAADFDEVNVGGLQNVIDACRAHGIARIVYTSSFLALPPAGRTHARSRRTTINAPRSPDSHWRARPSRAGVPVITLVPGVIYGPGRPSEGNLVGRLVHDHLAGRLPGIVGADRIWSFTHVEDVAAPTSRH